MPTTTDRKLKREWYLYAYDKMLARGVVYREWNLQVLWRFDNGWTAEQLSSLHSLFELFPMANRIEIEPIREITMEEVSRERPD